jgi:transposase
VDHPDVVIQHAVEQCEHCQRDLREVPAVERSRRPGFDRPHRPFEVTLHRADAKICRDGHAKTQAAFPPEVSAPVQYGPEIVARIVYLQGYLRLPILRIGAWFREEWQIRLRSGPVMRSIRQVADRGEPIMETVRLALQQDLHTIHADETGMRVRGQWW